jgi:outer membrane protein assembly factor BamA
MGFSMDYDNNSHYFRANRTLAVAWLLLMGIGGRQAVHAQLRSDLIESARIEKEANLTPETSPKAERAIMSVQKSVPYRLLTGDLNGFGVGFGNITPGAGFAVGPQYNRSDLLGGRLTVSVAARASVNESYLGRLDVSLPNLFGGRAFVDFITMHRDISEMPYYGAGPDSRKSGRSDYRLEDTNVELRPGFRPFQKLRVGLIGSYLAVNVGQGHSTRYISAERQYGPDVAPGIDRQTNFWRGGGFVEYDWRDRASNPTSGGKYSAQYVRYLDRDLATSSFLRLDLDATHYVPLFNHTRVIALHGSSSLTTTGGSQRVPFYLQPTLGGPDTLRGFRAYRFYGDNSAMVNAEYRWELSPILAMVAFADGGKVFNRWEQWNLHGIESDVGFGLRFKNRSKVAFSFDTGFSHEGFQVWFRVNNMF